MTSESKAARVAAALCAAACLLGACTVSTPPGEPQRFSSPGRAIERLETVIAEHHPGDAERLFGRDGDFLLGSGDPTLDTQRAERFTAAFNEGHELTKKDDSTYILQVGRSAWPFPVPIVRRDHSWIFDAQAGRQEILARRIGENELRAMAACRVVAQAQWIYAAHNYGGNKQYAGKLVSAPGKRDGLYWPAGEGEEQSPLGVFVAEAAEEGYTPNLSGEPKPYHGYLFRLFTQRPRAGHPRGSYWLAAYPVLPGESGVMEFACNQRGWIYETPAQDDSADALLAASDFGIDSTWTRVE